MNKDIPLSVVMTPTAELHQLHRDITAVAKAPAELQSKELLGDGQLEIRVRRAPNHPLIPSHFKFVWCVMEVFTVEDRVVNEIVRRQGRKDTYGEASTEARQVLEALEVERGA